MSILKKGMKGAPVKRVQEKLGIGADGIFGPGTEKAVKAFQEKVGPMADGIAGPLGAAPEPPMTGPPPRSIARPEHNGKGRADFGREVLTHFEASHMEQRDK